MVDEGERAPEFTAPMVTPAAAAGRSGEYTGDDVETFSLEDALDEGPVVLAFFPGVFSRTCTQELCEFRDWRASLGDLDAAVYGVSVDAPFPQLAFVDEYDLNYPLVSGFNNDVIERYGVRHDDGLLAGISHRSVFVIDPEGTVVYKWVVYEPQVFPDMDEIRAAVEAAT